MNGRKRLTPRAQNAQEWQRARRDLVVMLQRYRDSTADPAQRAEIQEIIDRADKSIHARMLYLQEDTAKLEARLDQLISDLQAIRELRAYRAKYGRLRAVR